MNDDRKNTDATEQGDDLSQKSSKRCKRKGRVLFFAIGFIAFAFGLGIIFGFGQGYAGLGHHGFASAWCPKDGDNGGHAKKMVAHLLDKVDATDAQKKKADAVVEKNADMFKEGFASFHGMKEEMMTLLQAKTIDRAALEKLRQKKMAAMDDMSRGMMTLVADVADILTPKQRATLATLHSKHHKEKQCEWEKKS